MISKQKSIESHAQTEMACVHEMSNVIFTCQQFTIVITSKAKIYNPRRIKKKHVNSHQCPISTSIHKIT